MVKWTLCSFLFLCLLWISNGSQQDRRGNRRQSWRDRFSPAQTYWDRHELASGIQLLQPQPRFTVIAPDLLRTDSQENIYLEAEGLSNPVTVSIEIKDFNKVTMLLMDNAILNQENDFHTLKSIQLSSSLLNREEKKNKFVFLTVKFQDHHTEERVMMVSFHSGYIFIQTDKPIYNPGDNVRFRTFVSSPFFKALDSSITIDIANSDGVVVKQIMRTRAMAGVIADTFTLPEFANEGTWQVTAKFDHWQQNTFTSPFQVKKYVLPAFNVTMTPTKSFISLDDSELEVEITARYLFGESVEGTAYVVFGVKVNQEMKRLPSVKQLSDLDGGRVSLSMEELKAAYPDPQSLVGHSVYVKASVLTKTGSDLVEAEKTGIKIVKSPYVISFTDSPKYFKPGLPLDLIIQVSNHDGSPARNVQVKVNLLDVPLIASEGTTIAPINMPNDQQTQTITVETTQADLSPDQQARNQITLQPYVPFNQHQQNYLYISTGSKTVSVGARVSFDISVSMSKNENRKLVKHITYLVLSRGKILIAKRLAVTDQSFTNVGLMVTSDLMPSFRVVAFFSLPWVGREEVVSDSVWIDVVDSCVGGLTIGSGDSTPRTLTPGESVKFKIRGDPGSKVNLVAVDNSVYLLNKDRLTQKKIWDVVEHGDIGCTRGGGRDASGVFVDAGLLYSSSAGFKTQTRQVLNCPGGARRRRSAEKLKQKQQLESHYKEKLERRCCKDGLREIPMPYSCTRRSLYITEGWECMRAFRYCCSTYRGQEFNTEIPTTPPPMTTAPPTTTRPPTTIPAVLLEMDSRQKIPLRQDMFDWSPGQRLNVAQRMIPKLHMSFSNMDTRLEEAPVKTMLKGEEEEEEDDYEEWEEVDESQIYLRHKFFESWLWMDVDLPSKAERDGLASFNLERALPDSITEWGVLAISASPDTGFCVAQPYNVKSRKDFFVDLRLPHSVARNEQLEIKAVVHNYGYRPLQARLVLMKTEKMCSVAFKDKHTQEVTVPASSSVAVHYTIVPLEVGNLPLEITAFAKGMIGSDRTQKFLRVVLEGVEKTKVQTVVLNPSAHGGSQTIHVGQIQMDEVVPNSVPETFINVRGNVLADSIDNSISKDSLAALIQMPSGCVEQNLASITLPVIATLYLDRTGGWESVGVQRKAEALGYIKRGYENQLAFRRSEGSYPPYSSQGASTWITAYVVKVFSMAYPVISINEKQICDPLVYLVNNKLRKRVGVYEEENPVYSTTMTGGLRGGDPEITLTAFVHIALSEAKQARISCTSSGVTLENANEWSIRYLKKALMTKGRRPYTVAIASYALALQKEQAPANLHEVLLQAASPDSSNWPDRENFLFQLEATGYALLALVKLGRMEEAAAPFNWLNNQRRRGGGFGSTQSTMVVLQALSEYMINKPREETNLDVDIKIQGRRDVRYRFNPETAYEARSSKLPTGHEFDVEVKGSGEGILEVVTYYNQLLEVDEKTPCNDFELSVNIEDSTEKRPADVIKTYQITIKVRALGPRDVRMVVLDISLPTGFTPENSDLEMLSNSVDRYISNFQIVDNLSERGSLIVHLFKVSHKEPEILIFRLQQNFKVGLLQPSLVTVYEYYNPDHRCSRTYTPKEDKEELSQICKDNVCRCAQGDCCVSKADDNTFTNKEREIFACNGLHHVFQVKVLSISQGYYDKYEMEITQVVKLGVEDGVEVGERRLFMSHGGCRDDLQLKEGSQYLLMGPREDQWKTDPDTNRFIYTLGKNTWVERWPLPAECSSMEDKCRSLSAAMSELSESGCSM